MEENKKIRVLRLLIDKIIFNSGDDVVFADGILSIFIYYPIIINI